MTSKFPGNPGKWYAVERKKAAEDLKADKSPDFPPLPVGPQVQDQLRGRVGFEVGS